MTASIAQILDDMHGLMGGSDPAIAPPHWRPRPEFGSGDTSFFEVETPLGRLSCVVGHEKGLVDSVVVDGLSYVGPERQEAEVTVLWDDARDEALSWMAMRGAEPGSRYKAVNPRLSELHKGPFVHRIAPGTPPNKTEFPLTGREPKPFWSLIFRMGD